MWIKICGIPDRDTALQVALMQPDAVGLNFYAPSPRSISLSMAAKIVEALPKPVEPVGLFVNKSVSEVAEYCNELNLNLVQLHGDETPEFLYQLQTLIPRLKIIRAYRMGNAGLAPLKKYLEHLDQLQVSLYSCLIDSCSNESFGGTGKTVAWDILNKEYQHNNWPPLILAGGLTPANVAQAILQARPFGVDTASGVESSPAVKDNQLVRSFIENSRNACGNRNPID